MLRWKLFNKIYCSNFIKLTVPSTYLFQKLSSAVSKGTKDLSKWTVYIRANTGPNGEPIATPYVKNLKRHLPNNFKTQVTFTAQKLSTQFNVKDRTKFEQRHDVIYFGKCPDQYCTSNYLGEFSRKISEQMIDHDGRDQKSHLFSHAVVNHNRNASYDDFKIIGSCFRNNTCKRKVAKALLIKELRPNLNVQEKLFVLKFFNLFP